MPDGGGTVVLYVKDGNSAALDVAFDAIAGSSLAPFYDDGGATSWTQSGGTGAAGVALFVDVPAGSVTIDGNAQTFDPTQDVEITVDESGAVQAKTLAADAPRPDEEADEGADAAEPPQ